MQTAHPICGKSGSGKTAYAKSLELEKRAAWHWSVYGWLEGETATVERIADPGEAATALAQFASALQRIDPTGGPPPGPNNFFRGVPLALRDPHTRAAIEALRGILDTDAATAAWEAALRAPEWNPCS